MGPGYDNKTSNKTSDFILIEVGGGSSGTDMIGLQVKLRDTYSVCTYDRAGYGKSEQAIQGDPLQLFNNSMKQMTEAMNAVGMPVYGKDRKIICIGHSFGG